MKKIAVLLLVAFAAMAFANPFSDVKFNHWAYDAVNKLAAKGIITGYPDGTFKGNKAVTRYDMAVIIARLLEQMKANPSIRAKMSKGDLDSVQKLVVEFADELSLLGVKVTALEDEMSAVKDDIAMLKEDVKTLKATGGNGGKIRFSGDIRNRFKDFDYDTDAVNDQYDRNFFETRFGLNLNMMIDPDVTAFVRFEKYSEWNTSAGDWANLGFTTDGRNTDFATRLAYVEIKDFFGWADIIRFGRQRFAIAHNLTIKGVADGIYYQKCVDKERNIVARVGALKNDDDNINGGVANEGLDLVYTDWTFDLHDVMAELYYMSMSNPFVNAATSTTLMNGNAGRYAWYGIALSGNPVPELTLWGEYTWLKADENVNVGTAAAPNLKDDDNAYLIGLNWDMNKQWALKAQYTKFEDYFFRPRNSVSSIWDIDTYSDPDETFLYDAMGYTNDFDDLMAQLTYKWSEKSTIIARYESIDDNRTYTAGQYADDRDVLTGIFCYQYKPNTRISLMYRTIDTENDTATMATNPVGTNGDNYGKVNTTSGATTYVVDDVDEIRLQLDVQF